MKKLNRLKIFYQQHILPIVYDYSMSLSEVVQKLVKVVNNLVDEVGDIEDRTGVYDDKIAALESKAADQVILNDHFNTAIDNINETISGLPTYDVIEDIRGDITNIRGDIAGLETRVEVLEGQNIYQRLDTAEQNIANLGHDIADINGDITDIQGDITNIGGDITNIRGDITDINGDITDIQGDITNIGGDITNIRGDITDIQGDITNIGGEITDIQGDITALEGAISGKSTVSVRIAQAATDSLAVITVDGVDYDITAQNGYNIWLYDIINPTYYTTLPNVLSALNNELRNDIDEKATQNQIDDLFSRIYLDYESEPGDYIDIAINQQSLSGHLTGSGKSVYIFIPFNKFLLFPDTDYSFSISGNITIRSINGYLRDSGNTYNFNGIDISSYNPQLYKNELGFRLVLTLPTAASATNNTPITAYFSSNGKIRITVL